MNTQTFIYLVAHFQAMKNKGEASGQSITRLLLSVYKDLLAYNHRKTPPKRKESLKAQLTRKTGLTANDIDQLIALSNEENTIEPSQATNAMSCVLMLLIDSSGDEEYDKSRAIEAANKLLELFDHPFEACDYLEKYCNAHKQDEFAAIHSCSFDFPSKDSDAWNREDWKTLFLKNAKNSVAIERVFQLFAHAGRVEKEFQLDATQTELFSKWVKGKRSDVKKLLYYAIGYENKAANSKAAVTFFRTDMSEAIFDEFLSLKPQDSEDLLPSPPSSLQINGLTVKKIPSADPRVALMGQFTGCCRRLGAPGQEGARYAVEKENSAVYGIFNKRGALLSAVWAWRDKDKVVFDGIESPKDKFGPGLHYERTDLELYTKLAKWLLDSEKGINQVYVGAVPHCRTPKDYGLCLLVDVAPVPPGAPDIYRDSTVMKAILPNRVLLEEQLGPLPLNEAEWTAEFANKITNWRQLVHCVALCPPEKFPIFSEGLKTLPSVEKAFEYLDEKQLSFCKDLYSGGYADFMGSIGNISTYIYLLRNDGFIPEDQKSTLINAAIATLQTVEMTSASLAEFLSVIPRADRESVFSEMGPRLNDVIKGGSLKDFNGIYRRAGREQKKTLLLDHLKNVPTMMEDLAEVRVFITNYQKVIGADDVYPMVELIVQQIIADQEADNTKHRGSLHQLLEVLRPEQRIDAYEQLSHHLPYLIGHSEHLDFILEDEDYHFPMTDKESLIFLQCLARGYDYVRDALSYEQVEVRNSLPKLTATFAEKVNPVRVSAVGFYSGQDSRGPEPAPEKPSIPDPPK